MNSTPETLPTITESEAEQQPINDWGMEQRRRLVDIVEEHTCYAVSTFIWNALLFRINRLFVNSNGKLSYATNGKPSKRLNEFLRANEQVIIENIEWINSPNQRLNKEEEK